MSSTRLYWLTALIFFLTILPVGLRAQDSATGAIRGVVLDSSGSRIAQASIVVVNLATGVRYSATSDAQGEFDLEVLPPGDYSVRAVAPGMSPQVTPQLHVDVGGMAALEFRLTVAGAQESVTVSAAPALVETQPSAVSTLLDERALNDFPLNGRRFSDLALFSPGVTQDPRSLNSSTNGDLSFGGIRGFQNTYARRRRRLQQRLLRAASRTRSRSLQFLDRGGAGVPRFHQRLRRGAGTLRRGRGECRHQVRLKSPARHGILLPARQFVWRGRCFSGRLPPRGTGRRWPCSGINGDSQPLQAAQPPAAGRRHHRRTAQAQQSFLLRRIRPAYFPRPRCRRIPGRRHAGIPQPEPDPQTPGDYEATDQALVCGGRAQLTSLAGEYPAAQIGNTAYGKLDINLTPRNQLALQSHHAILGSEQRVPRPGQPRHL